MCISTKVNTTVDGKNENSPIEAKDNSNENNNKEESSSNAPLSPRGVPTGLEVLM